jgi:hypothetical protein
MRSSLACLPYKFNLTHAYFRPPHCQLSRMRKYFTHHWSDRAGVRNMGHDCRTERTFDGTFHENSLRRTLVLILD